MSRPAHAHSDQHGASQAPGLAHDHDFAAANKAYFNEHANDYQAMHPEAHATAGLQIDAIRTQWPEIFDKERTTVMDFACGIGASASALPVCVTCMSSGLADLRSSRKVWSQSTSFRT